MGTILAIDPGNIQSGYVIVEHDGEEIRRVLEVGKIENNVLLPLIAQKLYGNGYDVAIEMIAGMGMTVGQEVFDTCVWIRAVLADRIVAGWIWADADKGVSAQPEIHAVKIWNRHTGDLNMPEEKNESSPREACGLPKQGNACPYAKLAPYLCARCGWNPEEHARRQALPLTENADGLRHKDISQPED